jgi:hypothetical protein
MARGVRLPVASTLTLALSLACANRPRGTPFQWDDHAGIVVSEAGRFCFSARVQTLAPNTSVSVVNPESEQKWDALVALDGMCFAPDARTSGLHGYQLRFTKSQPPMPFYGIGLIGVTPHFRPSDSLSTDDLDGDDRDEVFRTCTSSEGVHFTIWSGSPFDGVRRWHGYYPLGYDVSPTCRPADTTS